MTRKPISITVAPETESYHVQLFAICDDGTMWTTYFNRSFAEWDKWKEIPPIPQSESLFES